jgi:voltage-gated potassium channel
MNNNWKDDLNYGLAAFGVQIPDRLPLDSAAAKLTDHPATTNAAVVALSALLFYAAERGRNPKVNDVFDAMVYTSTCLSVGYGDIFAKTPMGKLLGSTLMTYGPALSNAALDGPATGRDDPTQAAILRTLQEILEKLQLPQQE